MNIVIKTFAVALVLTLTATGLWAAGADEEPAAAAEKEMVLDPTTGEMVEAPRYGGTLTYAERIEPPFSSSELASTATPWEEQLGLARLRETFEASPPSDAEDAGHRVIDLVNEFAGDVPQFDDTTCLVLRREN